MRTRLAAAAVLILGLVALGAPPTTADEAESWTFHLGMEGIAVNGGLVSDRFVGRALDDNGYNRLVEYQGTVVDEYFGFGYVLDATFTINDHRDGSTLTLELAPETYNPAGTFVPITVYRQFQLVVTGGTGGFAAVRGTGYLELTGSSVRLTGDLVLTLDP